MNILRFLFLLLSFLLFNSFNSNDSLLEIYYSKIRRADREISSKNYGKAACQIEDAINTSNYAYYHDLIKLIQCRKKNNPQSNNQFLFEKLICEKRLNPRMIRGMLNGKLNGKDEKYLFKISCDETESILGKEIIDLFYLDQKIRNYSECKDIEKDKFCYERLFSIRDSVDGVHAKKFIFLMDKYGMPDENEIGVFLDNGKIKGTYNHIFYVLGIHFLQTDNKEEILSIYREGLEKGSFHPELFAAIYDFYIENKKLKGFGERVLSSTLSIVKGEFYHPFLYYTDELEDSIDLNRHKIGLDSFRVFQKQILQDELCSAEDRIKIHSFPRKTEYPFGLIKAAFELEGLKMKDYKVDVHRICD